MEDFFGARFTHPIFQCGYHVQVQQQFRNELFQKISNLLSSSLRHLKSNFALNFAVVAVVVVIATKRKDQLPTDFAVVVVARYPPDARRSSVSSSARAKNARKRIDKNNNNNNSSSNSSNNAEVIFSGLSAKKILTRAKPI